MRALHAKSLLPQGLLHADTLVHWRWMVLPELSRLSLKLLNHSLFLIFASLGRGKPFFIFFSSLGLQIDGGLWSWVCLHENMKDGTFRTGCLNRSP